MPEELARNCFDVILQHDWSIEQCLLHIRVFFGGKTKSPCFVLSIHWLIKQITNTYGNYFSRSYENRSISSTCCRDHFFFRSMYNKAIIRFGLCDIQNYQGVSVTVISLSRTPISTLIILDITKASSSNFLLTAYHIGADCSD